MHLSVPGTIRALGILVAACLLAGCPAASGPKTARKKPPPPVNMVVTVGQNNLARKERTVPIRVVLDNNTDAFVGRLELTSSRGSSVTRTPVDLPRGAHKEYTLFVPLSPDPDDYTRGSGEVSLLAGQRPLARQVIAPSYPEGAAIVVSATGDGSGLQFLNGDKRLKVFHSSTRDLPRQWPGYEPADVVALNGRAWTEMDEDQRSAFRTWVEQGGRAILCGDMSTQWRDPDGQALAGVAPVNLAPAPALACVAPWGGSVYRATAGGGLLTVDGPLAPGSQALFSEGDRPLIVERRALLGHVVWLGFDAFRQTFREWQGSRAFWSRAVIAARAGADPEPLNALDKVDTAREAANSLPRLPAPPIGGIIGFGVVYALIFGPLNIWMLRRLRRTVRSWLFTPTLAVVMTLVALGVGQSWGKTRTVLNSVAVLYATNGSRTASERSLVGVFSPTNGAFDVSVDDPAPVLQNLSASESQDALGYSFSWPNIQAEGVAKWNSVPLQLYSTQLMQLERPVDLTGSVALNLSSGGDTAHPAMGGTVRNGTLFRLTNAYLRRQGRYYWIGNLQPGAVVTVTPDHWSTEAPVGDNPKLSPAELQERRHFREAVTKLWRNAGDEFFPQSTGSDLWLVAECPDHRPGLDVRELPFTSRAALLLVHDLTGAGR